MRKRFGEDEPNPAHVVYVEVGPADDLVGHVITDGCHGLAQHHLPRQEVIIWDYSRLKSQELICTEKTVECEIKILRS